MSIKKAGAACRQLVKMRSFREGMPTHMTNPVILVINGDEQNVGPLLFGRTITPEHP